MAGIFDPTYGAALDPTTSGLLSAAFSALSNSGPSLMPKSTGQIMGQAGQAGLQNYQQTRQSNVLLGLEQQKMALANLQYEMQRRGFDIGNNILSKYFPGLGSDGSGLPGTAPVVPGSSPAPVGGAAPAVSGPVGASPMELPGAALTLAGGIANVPAISKLGEMQFQASKVTPMRPNAPGIDYFGNVKVPPTPIPPQGMSLVQDPTSPGGWKAVPIPGAIQGAAAQTRAVTQATAEEQAKQRTVTVTTPDGRKVLVPESAITQPEATATTNFPVETPSARVEAAKRSLAILQQEKTDQAKTGQVDPGLERQIAATQKIIGAGQGITPAAETAQKENEIEAAKEASKGREAANIAVDSNYNLQHVMDASKGFETGQLAPTVMGARAFLQGAAPTLFPEDEMKKLTSFQEFNKYSIRLGFDQARKMGARESTQIVQMSIESNPNPKMVKPAIEAIANGLMAQNDYVIAKEKARDSYLKQNGKLAGFNSDWQSQADPRAFLLMRMDPASQAKMISNLSAADRTKLTNSLASLRKAGIF